MYRNIPIICDYIDFLGNLSLKQDLEYHIIQETMVNTVLEAMAAGLPIITTETGGTRELIAGNGLVIPQGQPDAIAAAILQYISDPRMCQDHGNRSRALSELTDWKRVAEQFTYYRRFLR